MALGALAVGASSFPLSNNQSTQRHISPSKNKNRNYRDHDQINSLLQNCRNINQLLQIHAKIIRNGHEQDRTLLFKILHFCSATKSMDYASKVFEQIENPNVYLYSAFMDGQIATGSYMESIQIYRRMVEESVDPDAFTFLSVLKACILELGLNQGREVHGRILKSQLDSNRFVRMKLMDLYARNAEFSDAHQLFDEMPEGDVAASTLMISCYVDHGLVDEAKIIFDRIPNKDMICWTAMIDGLARNRQPNEALELFRKMQMENVRPNEVTIVCVLSACSQLGALELGRWVHSYLSLYKIRPNIFVGSTLIDMYAKCGSLEDAIKVFNEMPERDVVTWNSMINGLAMHGQSSEALKMFKQMSERGSRPNGISFVGVLNACSHGGLVDMGFAIFNSMAEDYGIEPRIEHYGCMVDLLGRVGRLEEASDFIRKMRIKPDNVIWGALLGACRMHNNVELGECVAKFLVDEGLADSGTYILLSNIYAAAGKWEEAARTRAKMKGKGIQKEPGCSLIEVNNEIHEFLLGDLRHPKHEDIYKKLEDLNAFLKSEQYLPATELVLQDIEDDEKEHALAIHSERLAICFGLISTDPGTTIRVVKNLRVCGDCHSMIKLVAKISGRKIVIRDRNRFHHFENGSCSCGDYW